MTNDPKRDYGEIDMSEQGVYEYPDVYEFDQQQTFEHLAEEQCARQGTPIDRVVAVVILVFLVLAITVAGYALWYALCNPMQ